MEITLKSDPFPIKCCLVIITEKGVTLKIVDPKSGKAEYKRMDPKDLDRIQIREGKDDPLGRCSWQS